MGSPRSGRRQPAYVNASRAHLRVAVPTPPNPFSGLLFLVPEEDCVDVEMTVEEGMQYFVSLGMVGPAEMSLTPRNDTRRGG